MNMNNRLKVAGLVIAILVSASILLGLLAESRKRIELMECRSATVREVMVTDMRPSSQLSARAIVLLEYVHVDESLSVVEQIDQIILGLDRVCGRPDFANQ